MILPLIYTLEKKLLYEIPIDVPDNAIYNSIWKTGKYWLHAIPPTFLWVASIWGHLPFYFSLIPKKFLFSFVNC